VPVKLFSFHMVLVSLLLIAPDAPRLIRVLFGQPTGPSTEPPLAPGPRGWRVALTAQLASGVFIIGMNLYSAQQAWYSVGGGAAKSPLYGIWDVTDMRMDGEPLPPIVTDPTRWHRVIFDGLPWGTAIQRMDDSFVRGQATIDASARTVTFTGQGRQGPRLVRLIYFRPTERQLVLDGQIDGSDVSIQLSLVDLDQFALLNRGFRWVQEYPFNP
jgi:hypothetical protein